MEAAPDDFAFGDAQDYRELCRQQQLGQSPELPVDESEALDEDETPVEDGEAAPVDDTDSADQSQ
jgi:hypothetical protein